MNESLEFLSKVLIKFGDNSLVTTAAISLSRPSYFNYPNTSKGLPSLAVDIGLTSR